MKIAFLGTPDFAVPSLKMLVESGYDVVAVFCQPDRPKGRSGALAEPPTKQYAKAHGIPVYQPVKIRAPEGASMLESTAPDLMVTAAFGQILSADNLAVPKLGCINVHGSLLPKYRGAAPIQQAIIDGEKTTGVTTMKTDVGVDTGDMLVKCEIGIGPDETAGELFDRVANLGADTLKTTLKMLEAGSLIPIKQDEKQATHCRMLKKEDGHVDFSKTAQQVHNLVRGVSPWPGAYCVCLDTVLKLHRTRITDTMFQAPPGMVVVSDPKLGLFVNTGDCAVEIIELQAAGGKCMDAKAYLRGKSIPVGTLLC